MLLARGLHSLLADVGLKDPSGDRKVVFLLAIRGLGRGQGVKIEAAQDVGHALFTGGDGLERLGACGGPPRQRRDVEDRILILTGRCCRRVKGSTPLQTGSTRAWRG